MSGKLVSLMALIPMLVHSIFGCCWHHSHACHSQGQSVALTVASAGERAVGLCCRHADAGRSNCRSPRRAANSGTGNSRIANSRSAEVEAGAVHDRLPTGFPPCEEDRCLYSGMITTIVSPCSSLECQGDISFLVIDWPLLQQEPAATVSERADRTWPYSAHERCAISQVWQI